MIELARHIEVLLLDNDCVIVPGFGGFVSHHISARMVEEENTFLPPYRTIGFNPKMVLNDGLLVQSYMMAYDSTYPEAVRIVEAKVAEIKMQLEKEGTLELHGIGTLQVDMQGSYNFTPIEAGILSPTLYGFSSFEFLSLEAIALRAEQKSAPAVTSKVEEKILPPATKKPIVIHLNRNWVNNIVAAAVAIILFFVLSTPIENEYMADSNTQASMNHVFNQIRNKSLMVNLLDEHVKVSMKDAKPIEKSPATVQPAAPKVAAPAAEDTTYYTLVLASQVNSTNAEQYVKELASQHFNEAKVITTGKTTRVVYAQYHTEQEAYQQLNSLREHEPFAQAWVLKVK